MIGKDGCRAGILKDDRRGAIFFEVAYDLVALVVVRVRLQARPGRVKVVFKRASSVQKEYIPSNRGDIAAGT